MFICLGQVVLGVEGRGFLLHQIRFMFGFLLLTVVDPSNFPPITLKWALYAGSKIKIRPPLGPPQPLFLLTSIAHRNGANDLLFQPIVLTKHPQSSSSSSSDQSTSSVSSSWFVEQYEEKPPMSLSSDHTTSGKERDEKWNPTDPEGSWLSEAEKERLDAFGRDLFFPKLRERCAVKDNWEKFIDDSKKRCKVRKTKNMKEEREDWLLIFSLTS